MAERRRISRRSISYYLRITDAGTNQTIGHLSDISLKGIKIDSQKPITVPKEFRLRIYTASDVSDKNHIEFTAMTRWCRLDQPETGLYNIGFEIIRIDPSDAQVVQHIMDKYSPKESNLNF